MLYQSNLVQGKIIYTYVYLSTIINHTHAYKNTKHTCINQHNNISLVDTHDLNEFISFK